MKQPRLPGQRWAGKWIASQAGTTLQANSQPRGRWTPCAHNTYHRSPPALRPHLVARTGYVCPIFTLIMSHHDFLQ